MTRHTPASPASPKGIAKKVGGMRLTVLRSSYPRSLKTQSGSRLLSNDFPRPMSRSPGPLPSQDDLRSAVRRGRLRGSETLR